MLKKLFRILSGIFCILGAAAAVAAVFATLPYAGANLPEDGSSAMLGIIPVFVAFKIVVSLIAAVQVACGLIYLFTKARVRSFYIVGALFGFFDAVDIVIVMTGCSLAAGEMISGRSTLWVVCSLAAAVCLASVALKIVCPILFKTNPEAANVVKKKAEPSAVTPAKVEAKPAQTVATPAKVEAKPTQAAAKPATPAKAEAKPAQAETKSAEAKPAKADVKPKTAKAEVKAEAAKEAGPAIKPLPKAEAKPETKPEVKRETKPENKPEVKSAATAANKSEAKTNVAPANKAEAKTATSAENKNETKANGKGDKSNG